MSEDIDNLRMYADEECTQPISTIEWNNSVKIILVDGTEKILSHTAHGGEKANAIIWIRNEGPHDYGITRISFSDPRIQVVLSSAWVYPQRPIMVTLIFNVPVHPTDADRIVAGKINIEGYYIVKSTS